MYYKVKQTKTKLHIYSSIHSSHITLYTVPVLACVPAMPTAKKDQQKVPILKKTTRLWPSISHYSIEQIELFTTGPIIKRLASPSCRQEGSKSCALQLNTTYFYLFSRQNGLDIERDPDGSKITLSPGFGSKYLYSVVDPDPYWIHIQELSGSGSVFPIRIRIHTWKYRINE